MKGEYYLGLDMGSSSVGWAVTNEKYEILRAHGKTLWGVRLFDSAQTAEERRGFRTAKRRLDRRNWRIELLQKIFAEEVEKIDITVQVDQEFIDQYLKEQSFDDVVGQTHVTKTLRNAISKVQHSPMHCLRMMITQTKNIINSFQPSII